jgi:hypothetical protein
MDVSVEHIVSIFRIEQTEQDTRVKPDEEHISACHKLVFCSAHNSTDRLCGLVVVRVLGYRSVGPGSIPGTTKKK